MQQINARDLKLFEILPKNWLCEKLGLKADTLGRKVRDNNFSLLQYNKLLEIEQIVHILIDVKPCKEK